MILTVLHLSQQLLIWLCFLLTSLQTCVFKEAVKMESNLWDFRCSSRILNLSFALLHCCPLSALLIALWLWSWGCVSDFSFEAWLIGIGILRSNSGDVSSWNSLEFQRIRDLSSTWISCQSLGNIRRLPAVSCTGRFQTQSLLGSLEWPA